jgi:hypothetical protein
MKKERLCPVCGKPVGGTGRRKYCSRPCYKDAYWARRRGITLATLQARRRPPPEPATELQRRSTRDRNCLACGDPFPSSWPGHRICDRCKSRPEPTESGCMETVRQLRRLAERFPLRSSDFAMPIEHNPYDREAER